MSRGLLLALALLVATPALANPPERSPLPHWKPARAAAEVVSAAMPRPTDSLALVAGIVGSGAVARSILPLPRPEGLMKRFETRVAAQRLQPAPKLAIGKRGAVCGLPGVKGVTLAAIPAAVTGCGIANPVRVSSVEGVALSTPATLDCGTARALSDWVRGAVIPVVGNRGGGVARLQVAADYSCRPRNNVKGSKVSEHGRGKAIDISAIVLKNGAVLSVLQGWSDKTQGPLLKAMHKAACGPFGTVLGPSANSFHRDHLHLDTASYRSGHYCR